MLLPRLVAHLGHYCVQRCNYCCRKDNKDNVALHLHAAIAMMLQNNNYNNYLTGYSKEMAIKALKCCRWQCHCLPQSYPLFVRISHRDHLHVFTALMNAHSYFVFTLSPPPLSVFRFRLRHPPFGLLHFIYFVGIPCG